MSSRLWILGAADPEMERVEALLRGAGETVAYATVAGRRVTPGEAYKADALPVPHGDGAAISLVECQPALDFTPDESIIRIDHHRPGDPGFGRPPSEFLAASSLGQTIAELARLGKLPSEWPRRETGIQFRHTEVGGFVVAGGDGWEVVADCRDEGAGSHLYADAAALPTDLVLAAASDHCPGAAYAGQCPGVEPEALMAWRAATRAAFQKRPVGAVMADVEATSAAIKAAPEAVLAGGEARFAFCAVADLRGASHPELPEAALRLGVAVLADGLPGPDGRRKVVLMGAGEGTPAGPEPVRAFLGGWAAGQGLVDLYGDPARGFAGGYKPSP